MENQMKGKERVNIQNSEAGFTIIEVAVAAVISTVSLVFLASLFILGISQNRLVKQFTTATKLGQQKLELLNAIERLDARLAVGGGLNITGDPKQANYNDTVFVDPDTGTITTVIPEGVTPIYDRFWKIEADPSLTSSFIISVRVVARQASVGSKAEEVTLTTARSW
jgi:type II secretory pathway pseudopilin PulG